MDKIVKRYERFFSELTKDRYHSFNVYDYFVAGKTPSAEKVNVILRFDVDCNLYFAYQAAKYLKDRKINASFYFLPSTEQYNIWENQLVREISQMGFEVGIHSDHLSRQINSGIDGITAIKEEVFKFTALIGKPPEGMVFHVGSDDVKNWHLYKYLEAQNMGLKYHDGFTSSYHDSKFNQFISNADYTISDYFIVPNGWRLRPFMPKSLLKKAKKGESVHFMMHPTNMFKYWEDWPEEYGKEKLPKVGYITLLGKVIRKLSLKGMINIGLILGLNLVVVILQLIGKIFYHPNEKEKTAYANRTTYNGEEDFISQKRVNFWEQKIKEYGFVADRKVLDLGCGMGQWMIPLSSHNKIVVGIDPCFKSLSIARQRLNQQTIRNISLVKGQGETLPYKNDSFDSIFCYGVLMYAKEFTALGEMARVLKKGGRIFIAVDGAGYFLKNIIGGIKFSHADSIKLGLIALANTLIGKYILKRENNFASFFTHAEIRALFRKYGFKLMQISPEVLAEEEPYNYLGFPFFFKAIGEKL